MEVFGEKTLEVVLHAAGNEDGLQGFAVVKGIFPDDFQCLVQAHLDHVDAALEGLRANDAGFGGEGNLFQLPAVHEGRLANLEKAGGQLDGEEFPALGKGGVSDVGDGIGQVNLLQVRGTLLKGNILADFSAGHVVLEGEDVVRDNLTALADGDFFGEIFCVGEILAVFRDERAGGVPPAVSNLIGLAGGHLVEEDGGDVIDSAICMHV